MAITAVYYSYCGQRRVDPTIKVVQQVLTIRSTESTATEGTRLIPTGHLVSEGNQAFQESTVMAYKTPQLKLSQN